MKENIFLSAQLLARGQYYFFGGLRWSNLLFYFILDLGSSSSLVAYFRVVVGKRDHRRCCCDFSRFFGAVIIMTELEAEAGV